MSESDKNALTFPSLAHWLDYIESIHATNIDMGLTRVKLVASHLDLEFDDAKILLVGGTNGKGSTCAFIETALLNLDKKVAVYSSPHLFDYRERVRYQGNVLDESLYCQAMEKVEQARGDTSLTYFEFGTLAALVMMQALPVDIIILEVGLGGRLDATNILNHDVAVLTSIGIDHQEWLGSTREKIGLEKIGICRKGKPIIMGEPDVPGQVKTSLLSLGAVPLWRGGDFSHLGEHEGWECRVKDMTYSDLPAAHIPHQNVVTALTALSALGVTLNQQQLISCISSVKLVGRRQFLSRSPYVIVDVAHNPHATLLLSNWIKQFPYRKLHLVVGMLSDKLQEESMAPFFTQQVVWYLGDTDGARGMAAESLANFIPKNQETYIFPSVTNAFSKAMSMVKNDDMILVFGSFLSVAKVLESYTSLINNRKYKD